MQKSPPMLNPFKLSNRRQVEHVGGGEGGGGEGGGGEGGGGEGGGEGGGGEGGGEGGGGEGGGGDGASTTTIVIAFGRLATATTSISVKFAQEVAFAQFALMVESTT